MNDTADFSGLRLGRYDLLSILGRGGMGVVYDAIDPALGRHVAVKILPTILAGDANRLARFVQEARAASALNHPNVVAIYEIGCEQVGGQEVHFIAMEMVDGTDLRGLLAGTRLPVERAIDIVAQITDAIASAHSEGIVHRDLKPENIVLSKTGNPKVLDFGLAKLRAGDESWGVDDETAVLSTAPGVILGTVGYMSPEQAQSKPADHRSDIFSLGCILYEAVAGRRAFAAGSLVETLNAIININPPALRESASAASPELQRITSKAMAKNPDERYQSAKEMLLDLRAILRDRTGSSGLAPRSTMRRTAVAALIVLAVVAIVVAIAFAFRSRREMSVSPSPSPTLSVRRLTSRGTVTHAAISPDGRFVAYALLDRSIRLRQLVTGQEIEVARVGPLALWGLTFTPDGSSIIYVARNEQTPVGSCFRVATIGGRPEHLFDGIDSGAAVSPDGRRIAWARAEYPRPGESALMVANLDGSDARAVATRRRPEKLAPLFFAAPSWSPDGAWIATAVERLAEPLAAKVILVDSKSGAERILLDRGWPLITQTEWLSDGRGIVIVASDEANDITRLQLWLISYPGGTPRRITTEMASYRGASVAAQKDLLVSIVLENNGQVWSVPLDEGASPEKISTGRYDGWRGLTLTPDGRVVFTSIEEEVQTLVISNRDGSGRTRLTRDSFSNQNPASFQDGIAYVSSTPHGSEVCVTSFEGDGRRVVARDVDPGQVAVSPDGKWILFQRNRRLWKAPVAGGEARQLLDQVSSAPAWSPDGERIAILLGDSDTFAAQVAVISSEGRLSWSAPLGGVHPGSVIRWLPDASGVIVNGGPRGSMDDRNLWAYPFRGKPRPLTAFTDQRAFFWDLSPDGRTAFVARANLTRDAVLVTGFR